MILNDYQIEKITGGATGGITSTFLNSLSRFITTILDLGRTIGSSISRYKNKNYCS